MTLQIRIEENRCNWGEPVNDTEDAALHDAYRKHVAELVTEAYPDADLTHEIDRRTAGGLTRVVVHDRADTTADHTDAEDAINELTDRAWQMTIDFDARAALDEERYAAEFVVTPTTERQS